MKRVGTGEMLRSRLPSAGLADVGLVVVGIATVAMVGRALDVPAPGAASITVVGATSSPSAAPRTSESPAPSPPAPTDVGPPGRGVVALDDARSWRWLGPEACDPARPTPPIETSVDGGAWRGTGTPLHWVADLDANPDLLVAVGAGRDCAPAAAVSPDGGATWERADVSARAVDLVADAAWVIDTSDVLRVGPALARTAPVAVAPCAASDAGPASLVAGISAREALVLCQRPDGGNRLLVHTGDGGRSWRRYAGKRVESGLAGGARIVSLSMVSGGLGLAVVSGGTCPQGEARTTADGGTLWRTLPCAALPAVAKVLVAELRADGEAVLVGVSSAGEVQTWSSSDAGGSWTRR